MTSAHETISLDSQVELPSGSGQFDRATAVASRMFNDAALPPGTPDWLRSAVDEQAAFAQRLPGTAEWTIGQAGGGSLGQKSRQEREAEAQEESIAALKAAAEEMRGRERDRWAGEMHTFGNVTMSGAEWSQLGDDLHHDTELRRWLVERLQRDGRSAADANAKADEIADVATIMGKPESQRTDEERAKLERAKTDPTFTKIMPELNDQRLNGADRLEPTAASDQKAHVATYADRASMIPGDSDPRQSALGVTASVLVAPAVPATAAPPPAAAAGLDL